MRKILRIGVWLSITAYLVVVFSFAAEKQKSVVCSDIQVRISDSLQNKFVTSADVIRMLEPWRKKLIGTPLGKINTCAIEQELKNYSLLKSVKVYKTTSGTLFVEITQRQPLIRIINAWNENFYIDTDGNLMPWSSKFTAFVPVANGNIRYHYSRGNSVNVSDSTHTVLSDLYLFATYLQGDRFWGAQIEEIYVNDLNEFEIIPRVGSHLVLLGTVDQLQEKLSNLRLLYKRGFGEVGWNGYDTINLKYKNQIICVKR